MRLLLALAFWFLAASTSWAQVAHDASSTYVDATATSVSTTHTTGSGSNRVLIACHHINGADSTGATYNGVAMTLVASQVSHAGLRYVAMYKLLNPPTGSYTLTGTTSATQAQSIAGKSFSGVDQTTPLGTHSGVNGGSTGTSLSTSVSSSVDGMGVDCLTISNSSGTPAADAGQSNANTTDDSTYDAATSTDTGAATITMGWSWTGGQYRALIVAPLVPAATGGPGPLRRRGF